MAVSGSGEVIESLVNFNNKDAWLYLQAPPGGPWVLHLDNPTIASYEVISLENGEILYRGGLAEGAASRAVFHPDFLHPMSREWEDNVLLRIDGTDSDFVLAVSLLTVSQVTRVTAIRFLGDGMYYGVTTLTILFSFLVTLSSGYGHSRRLGLCLLAWLLTMITVSGYGNLLIWPNNPEVGIRIFPVFSSLAALSTAWFAWHFLRRTAQGSSFLKGVQLCIWLNGLILLAAAGSIIEQSSTMISMVTTGFFIACAASVSALRGDIASRYLFVSIFIAVAPFPIIGTFPVLKHFIAVSGTVALLFMVTAVMKRLEQRTRKHLIEARVVATRAKFLASMSHELRTPLNGVIGFSELCAQEELSADAADYVSQIQRSSKLLLNVVNEVLDFSKLEAGAVEISLRAMNLSDTIDNITATLAPTASANNVKLIVTIDDIVAPNIVTDPIRCSQILINLLSNAIKFSKDGEVELTVRQHAGRLEFEVKDNGIGIPKEFIKSLFDPYQQANSGTLNALGGTGLGLTIAKQFSELLGGSIAVESVVGKGSVFTLMLPYVKADLPEAVDISKLTEVQVTLNGVSVLVAEDNQVNQLLARKILEQTGATVETAENGKVAVELVVANAYDIILMDVQMPLMDGIEATQLLRDKGCQVPIIALTANNSESDKSACLHAGMSDFLAKPFVQADLIRKVEQFVSWENNSSATN